MKDKALQLLRMFGVNRAIGFGVLTRLWSALAGPLTILLIATRLSKVEQGFYYTFSSILALQVFFELGLLTVLAQFAAHEFAFLSWGDRGEIRGSEAHRDRFIDLLGKGFKWYSISAVLLIIVLIPVGLLFFSQRAGDAVDFAWRLPWALAVTGVGCNLLLIPFYAVITGSGDVASINRREMMGGMAGSLTGWLVIACGGGLYAIPAVTTGTIVVGVLYLARSKPLLVKTAFARAFGALRPHHTISWWGEVWPMQWKIALSWVSGYFIFQLFTPVLFKYHGPVVAGQMGMTLSAVNGVTAISMVWMQAQAPNFGKLIAQRDWNELDRVFKKVFQQTVFITTLLAVFIAIAISLLKYIPIGQRFLPIHETAILLCSVLVNSIIWGLATYMRAHKVEPMLAVSVVGACLTGLSTVLFGIYFQATGIAIGYLFVNLFVGLPWTIAIFSKIKINHDATQDIECC